VNWRELGRKTARLGFCTRVRKMCAYVQSTLVALAAAHFGKLVL